MGDPAPLETVTERVARMAEERRERRARMSSITASAPGERQALAHAHSTGLTVRSSSPRASSPFPPRASSAERGEQRNLADSRNAAFPRFTSSSLVSRKPCSPPAESFTVARHARRGPWRCLGFPGAAGCCLGRACRQGCGLGGGAAHRRALFGCARRQPPRQGPRRAPCHFRPSLFFMFFSVWRRRRCITWSWFGPHS